MRAVVICLLIGLLVSMLFFIIIIFPPKAIADLNEKIDVHLGVDAYDKSIARRLAPVEVKVVSDGREEHHRVCSFPASPKKRYVFLTIPLDASATINDEPITTSVEVLQKRKTITSYMEPNREHTVRVICVGKLSALVQVAEEHSCMMGMKNGRVQSSS